MKAKSMCMIILLGVAAVAGLCAAESKATAKEKDGWVIFSLSYLDASKPKKREFIGIVEEAGARTINYSKLKLSCGTYMSGSLKEETVDGLIRLRGVFEVSSNPYGITSLEVDLSRASANKSWDGKIVVDGVSVDIKDAR